MSYNGCLIEESLKDKSILNAFRLIETIFDDGEMYIVEIDDERLEEVLPKLQSAMTEDKTWYADLKNNDYHYIIYNDKIFKVDRNFGEQYEQAKAYGLKRGIPECQLPDSSWAKQAT